MDFLCDNFIFEVYMPILKWNVSIALDKDWKQ